MPQFLVTIHRSDGFDPARDLSEDARRDIQALNAEMRAAGVRVFVGGLNPPGETKSLSAAADGTIAAADGPLRVTGDHIDGLWVLETDDLDAALGWGRKAAVACRAQVEVRPFH